MSIVIYEIMTEDQIRFGHYPTYSLSEPYGMSREWINKSEYNLPDGYSIGKNPFETPLIFDEHGIGVDVVYHRGGPAILLTDGMKPKYMKLEKIRDLEW